MKLSVLERILLADILPKQGDVRTLRVLRDLQADLSFDEEEIKLTELRREADSYRWNAKQDPHKDVAMGEVAREIVKEQFQAMDKNKTIPMSHLDLYDRFFEAQ